MQLLSVLLLLPVLACAATLVSAAQSTALREAMVQVRADNWRGAAVAAQSGGEVVRDIVEWHRLREGGQAEFDAYRDFLSRRGDWPGLALLRNRGEGSIPTDAAPAEVIGYFNGRMPVTGAGVVRLVSAFRAMGQNGDALATAVLAWRSMPLSSESEAALLEVYGSELAAHDEARLDEMLWQGNSGAAQRALGRVSEDWQKLARARIALATQAPGVDIIIAAVPATLADDPGLAYERFNWRARKGREAEAVALMEERSVSPEKLGRPEKWANWRRIYARNLMRDGRYEEAYTVASLHFLVEGSDFADLEWLSGYLALRFLKDPELAVFHFEQLEQGVQTPISLGRAGYWIGRAYAAMGDEEAALAAYARGAQNQSSFYGLLAAEAAGLPMDPTLAGTEVFPPLDESPLDDSSVLEAGLLLLDAGEPFLAEQFLTHLAEGRPREEVGTLATLMLNRGEEHIALMIAKRAAGEGTVVPAAYFPLSPRMDRDLPVARELALAIARRESEFDPKVVSPAGARGLMQLMPGTARDVSAELGISYDRDGLTDRPSYNVTLGSTYLAGLIEAFGAAPVLVAVGYNAGPGRSLDWVRRYGDPRSRDIDVVDWVEMIPFRETQNYVMRVTESVMVYRARLSGKTGPVKMTDYLYEGK